jgi:hypothetical protein
MGMKYQNVANELRDFSIEVNKSVVHGESFPWFVCVQMNDDQINRVNAALKVIFSAGIEQTKKDSAQRRSRFIVEVGEEAYTVWAESFQVSDHGVTFFTQGKHVAYFTRVDTVREVKDGSE